jgi:hypothetical protein
MSNDMTSDSSLIVVDGFYAYCLSLVLCNSYLFNEFVCNFGFFWHEWTSLKLE